MALHDGREQEDFLLEGAVRGERACLEALVERHQNMAFMVAMKVVRNREDAEEVVQDSFMRAFGALHKFTREARFSTWLYRIVYNTALTNIAGRKMNLVDVCEQQEDLPELSVKELSSDLLNIEDQRKFVQLALAKLERDDALVITLHYIGEKNIAEICEILTLSKSAVKMRLLRGRKQLQEMLEGILKKETRNLL